MKKQKFLWAFFLSLCLCFTFLIFPIHSTQTYADKITDTNESLLEYGMDRSLYNALKKLAQHLTNGGTGGGSGSNAGTSGTIDGFDLDVFNPNEHSLDYYNPSTTYGEAILADLKNGVLNLTTGADAAYGCLESDFFNIQSVAGLDKLELSNINTLILDNNAIKDINAQSLSGLPNLTNITVKNNNLQTFSLSNKNTKVTNLNLSHNQIKKIDLSLLAEVSATVGATVDISFNKIENLEDIKFSNKKLNSLDLSFNNLTKLNDEDITLINSHLNNNKFAEILIQGSTDYSKLYAGDSIKIFPSEKIENFNIKFFYNEESKFYNESEDNLIYQTPISQNIQEVKIPAGKIKVLYCSGDTLINADNFSSLEPSIIENLTKQTNYSVKIKNVAYTGFVNNQVVTNLTQGTDIKVVLSIANIDNIPNKEDVLSANGAEFHFYTNIQNTSNGNTIEVKNNGRYSYYAYLTFDGLQSELTRIQIVRQDFTNITWGVIIIIIVFVVICATYFIIKWFRNGAQIAPLSEKEIYRMNKRRGTLTETNNDDYILSLDAPRHDKRVSDAGYSDNVLEEDLNATSKTDNYNSNYSEDIKPTNDFPDDIN